VRSISTIDVETLARACEQSGWVLDAEATDALRRALPPVAFGLVDAITLISEAAMNHSGFAFAEVTPLPEVGSTFVIAFRHGEHIHFGVGYGKSMERAWPILAPWSRDFENNRKQLERWTASKRLVRVALCQTAASEHEGGEALLAAILADPNDVEARIVYADWLLARGDVRGEIIALAEHVRSEPEPELARRLTRLLDLHSRQLAGEVANEASDWTLERGFVVRVEMRAPAFARAGADIVARNPIETLELRPLDSEALKQLTDVEALRAIRVLRLASWTSHSPVLDIRPLSACPFLDSLRELDIRDVVLHEESGTTIASMVAPTLESLRLVNVAGSLQLLQGLLENQGIRLRRLVLELGTIIELQAQHIVELLLALPDDHPLATVELGGAAPELIERLRTRFRC
jgi:uncharacterized protein (TIGR02996 family)